MMLPTSAEWWEKLKSVGSPWLIAAALAALALVLLIALNPGFAVREVSEVLERRAGLELKSGSSRIQFFPSLALRLEDVQLVTQSGRGHQLMQAPVVTIPMRWRALLSRKLRPDTVSLESPVFNIVIDGDGNTGWTGKGDALDAAVAQNSAPGEALRVTTADGTLKFLDERSGQRFELTQGALRLAFERTGAVELTGSAAIAQQFAHIEAHLASLLRLSEEGSPLDLTLEAPALQTSFSGWLSLRGGLGLAGTFQAASNDAGKLVKWLGIDGLPEGTLKDISVSGPLSASGAAFTSSRLTMRLNGSEVKGSLTLNGGGPRLALSGMLTTDKLALSQSPGDTSAGKDQAGWPTTALPLDWIKSVDTNIELSAYSLGWQKATTGPTTLTVKTTSGVLEAQLAQTPAYGGSLEGTLSVDANAAAPKAALVFSGEGLDLGKASHDLTSARWLAAQGGATLNLTAEGKTVEEMISTLAGEASVNVTQGSIKGFDLARSIAAAATGDREGWIAEQAAETPLADVQGTFQLRDGIANTDDLRGRLAGVEVSAKGNVDLLRQALDLSLAPRSTAGKIPLAVRVKGPWQKPKLTAEVAGLLLEKRDLPDKKDIKKAAKKAGKFLKKVIGN